MFTANSVLNKARLLHRLRRLSAILGSSREQLDAYASLGIERQRIAYCPLFFPKKRLHGVTSRQGGYFIVAGSPRLEKGLHLLKNILPYCSGAKVKIAFKTQREGEECIKKFGLDEYVKDGRLDPVFDVGWETGLKELYAESKGVLITSIWPTTTEFALLEALGLGKPVIAFGVGIHGEVISNYINGLVAPVGDAKRFAEYVSELDSSPELCDRLSRGASELFDDLTSDGRSSSVICKLLDSLSNSGPRTVAEQPIS